MQNTETVIMDKTVVCNEGTIRYLTSTALNTDFSISDDFYYAVKNLPRSYDQSAYLEFIDYWGTVSKKCVSGTKENNMQFHFEALC